MSKFEYLKLADTVAVEIASGVLKPGDRLPPQRSFAYERKIAVSTASRVYAELLRRGLVVGEVGRGTFISGDARRGAAAPGEAKVALVDGEDERFRGGEVPVHGTDADLGLARDGVERDLARCGQCFQGCHQDALVVAPGVRAPGTHRSLHQHPSSRDFIRIAHFL